VISTLGQYERMKREKSSPFSKCVTRSIIENQSGIMQRQPFFARSSRRGSARYSRTSMGLILRNPNANPENLISEPSFTLLSTFRIVPTHNYICNSAICSFKSMLVLPVNRPIGSF